MHTNDREIMGAIARSKTTTDNEIFNISKMCSVAPQQVERFYNGSALSLWEIKEFVTWKNRLPTERESTWILYHGVWAMKNIFNNTF